MQGSFGYELDLGRLSEQEISEAKEQIAIYNANYELFLQGDYYRLASPMENRDYTAWSYVIPDGSRASLSVVYTDVHANPKPVRVRLRGLTKKARYQVGDQVYTGAALMQGGLVIPKPECSYDSFQVFLHRLPEAEQG